LHRKFQRHDIHGAAALFRHSAEKLGQIVPLADLLNGSGSFAIFTAMRRAYRG
jgi:hypothetical protein